MRKRIVQWALLLPVPAMLVACDDSNGGGGGGGGSGAPAAGMLDAAFGTGGVVVHDNAAGGNADDAGNAVAAGAGGAILVAGDSWGGSNYDVAVWRFTSSGALDTSFGTSGVVTHDNAAGGGGTERGYALAVDASGRILVAGASWNGSSQDMALWRFTPSGALDTSFGTNGVVTHDSAAGGSGADFGLALAVDAAGRVLVAGFSWGSGTLDMALWRFTPSGALDASFNGSGVVTHDSAAGGTGGDYGNALAIDAGGNIVVAGYSTNTSGNKDLALWRFTSSGALDTSFNGSGVVVHDSAAGGSGDDAGNAVGIDTGGNIVVAGYSTNAGGNKDLAVWRLTASGAHDTGFGTGGIVTHDNAAGGSDNDYGNALAIDTGGNVLVAGYSANAGGDEDMVLWRFTPGGALDTGFGTSGIVIDDNAAGGSGGDYGNALAIEAGGRVLVAGYSDSGSDLDMALWRYR